MPENISGLVEEARMCAVQFEDRCRALQRSLGHGLAEPPVTYAANWHALHRKTRELRRLLDRLGAVLDEGERDD